MKINWLDESSLTYEEAVELLNHSHEKRLEMEDENKWDAYVNYFTFWTFLNDTYGYMLDEVKEEVDDFYLKYFFKKDLLKNKNFLNKSIDKREIIYYNQQAFEKKAIAFVGMYVVHIYGGIAQLARVLGSYPIGRRFESHCRYQFQHTYLHKVFHKRALSPSYMARWSSG